MAVYDLGTSIRSLSAAETVSAVTPFLEAYDICGFADHTPCGSHVIHSIEVIRGNPRSGYLNLGKGFGLEAALASGYMEAIEMRTVEGSPEIQVCDPPCGAPLYLQGSHHPPSNDGMIAGIDLLSGGPVYAPIYDHFLSHRLHEQKVYTNGLASGNSMQEACVHALYELIERHLTGRSLRDPSGVRRLRLRDVPPLLASALREVEGLGMRVEFFLLGRTLGVIAVKCVLVGDGQETLDVHYGWGAHHSVEIALARALAEAVQNFATRKACQTGKLPASRMPGGALISAKTLQALRAPMTLGELALFRRYAGCTEMEISLAGKGDSPTIETGRALSDILDAARTEVVDHVYLWTLSPTGRPFVVVKCVIPTFENPFEATE